MKKKNSRVKVRHKIFLEILRYPVKLIFFILLNYRCKKIKLKKDENVFVLSNHQTDYDPILVSLAFNKPIYYVGTDTLFSNKFVSSLLNFLFAPIPKRKGTADIKCIKDILKTVKENGSVGIFAEGNRSYAEFQFHIDISMAKLIKSCKLPLILFNLHGGNGISPRFAHKLRKGKLTGNIKRRIEVNEYMNMSDEELLDIIKKELIVYDSASNQLFKSKKRAEYLERMLFVCPNCNKTQTLYSKNEYLYCNNCDLKVEFCENLSLKSDNKGFKFNYLIDWYNFQKEFIKNNEFIDNQVIFTDENVKLYISHVNEPRKLIKEGKLTLTTNQLIFDDFKIDVKDIIIASPIGGRKFNFSTLEESYFVIGDERFNPLKYVLMFNMLDTHMKGNDKYFSLD